MQEGTTDRELYVNILQTIAPSPFVIRTEIETHQQVNEILLPTAKFDIIVNKLSDDCTIEDVSVTGLLAVDGTEEAMELLSSKTDSSIQLQPSPSMPIA